MRTDKILEHIWNENTWYSFNQNHVDKLIRLVERRTILQVIALLRKRPELIKKLKGRKTV